MMVNVVSEPWVVGGDIGGRGMERCLLGIKSRKSASIWPC